ncbi:MAG: DUF4292 domain-containing protein [Bacteroidota bacterium]
MLIRLKPYTLLFVSALILGAASCKTRKQAPADTPCKIDYKNARTLTALLKSNLFDFKWLSAKFSGELIFQGKTSEFNVSVRARKDSVIWMSITDPVMGAVEGARVLITRDSVKFMDRLNKRYFTGGFDTLKKLFNVDELDFEMIQSIMVGNSVEFYEEEEKMKPGTDKTECRYFLGTVRKRKFKKAMEKGTELKDPAQSIWLDPEKFKILRIFFTDYNTNRTFDVVYDNFQPVDSMLFPHQVTFDVKAEKSVQVKIRYSKVKTDAAQSFPFTIPESYERIQKN